MYNNLVLDLAILYSIIAEWFNPPPVQGVHTGSSYWHSAHYRTV